MGRIKRAAAFLASCLLLPASLFAAEVTLAPRTTGTFRTNFKHLVQGGESKPVKLPIPFYVIRHPEGIVLFDSGLGENIREQIHGWWVHRLFQLLLPYRFRKDEAAVNQLKEMGIEPGAVRYIVISHFHYDHVGGLRDFPHATVVVSRAEWEHANVGRWKARFRGVMTEQLQGVESRLWIVDYQPGTSLGPFYGSFDLFGDGSLILVATPGHTPGHQSLLVTLGSGQKIFLTGDAVWVRENYNWPAPKSWMVRFLEEKADQAWETTLKIRKFREENPDVFIIPGHDPNLWPELPSEFH
jgi:glyoxylase-like metal-dependent hydrolase (beta-lactamase superfamily II)